MHAATHQPGLTPPPTRRRRTLLDWFGPLEPHLARGPFARWPRTTDAALALAVFAGSLIAVAVSALADGEDFSIASIGEQPPAAIALLAVASASLLWRRHQPVVVAALVMTLLVVWALAGYGDGQDLAVVVAIYSVGRYTAEHRHSVLAVAAVIAISLLGSIVDANQRIDVAPAILLAVLPWYVGRRVRNRGDYVALLQERAEQLEADQQARARQAVADERSRIARELHDVVAHQVSMMTVQAGAAKTIAGSDLDAAVEAMGDVEQAGRQALGELRHLLGVLHPDTTSDGGLGPQPGLGEIASLADELRHTGALVSLTIGRLPDDVSAAIDLSAYRIAQESVTNIVKHAGPKPTVDLSVESDDAELVITVTNTTAEAVAMTLPGAGFGISGMRERASLLGGTLTAEPIDAGRFRVQARIPLRGDSR